MANVSFFAPKYRRHKATGQAVVVIRGNYFYLGKHGSSASREAYRRLVAEYMQTGTTPTQTTQDTITVVEVLAAYLKFARTYYRKNGKTTDELTAIKRAIGVVQELYGRKPACEFGPLALKAVQGSMIDRGWCRNQINKHIDRVRRVFKWAVSEEIIPSSVHESLRTVSGLRRGRTKAKEGEPVRPVADSVVEATLEHLPVVVADMVRLQRLTGMRPGEVCIVRPCDLDRSGDVWVYRPGSHKVQHYDRERVIPIGPNAQDVLLRYLARDSKSYCFQPRDSERKRQAERHADRRTPMSCGNRPGSNRLGKPSPHRITIWCVALFQFFISNFFSVISGLQDSIEPGIPQSIYQSE